MILVTKTIQNVQFDVEIALNSKICILHWGDEKFFFEDVDLAQVIRAVQNSNDFGELAGNVKGIWREETILPSLKSIALDEISTDDFIEVLTQSDEWIRRKMDTISSLLRGVETGSDNWLKYRSMMYDTIMSAGVLE